MPDDVPGIQRSPNLRRKDESVFLPGSPRPQPPLPLANPLDAQGLPDGRRHRGRAASWGTVARRIETTREELTAHVGLVRHGLGLSGA